MTTFLFVLSGFAGVVEAALLIYGVLVALEDTVAEAIDWATAGAMSRNWVAEVGEIAVERQEMRTARACLFGLNGLIGLELVTRLWGSTPLDAAMKFFLLA